mgnify:CR=1 FL=1
MELNQELKDMYEKLKDISVNDLGGFIDTSNSSFQSLNSSIGDTLSSVSIGDSWDDDIKLELNNVTYNGINNIIASCSEVITNVCTPLGTKVPNLVTELSNYLKEYENYETALENRGKVNIGSEPVLGDYDSEESYRTAHSLWSSRNSQYDGYTSAMTIAERNASRYEKNALQDITAIKELLSDERCKDELDITVPIGSAYLPEVTRMGKFMNSSGINRSIVILGIEPQSYVRKEYLDKGDAEGARHVSGGVGRAVGCLGEKHFGLCRVGECREQHQHLSFDLP